VALELEVEAVLEERRELLDEPPGRLHLAAGDGATHHRRKTAGGGDETLVALAEQIEVDTGLVVEALQVALGHQVHEVAVPGLVHRQQQQMVDGIEAAGVALALLLVEARRRGHVHLAADDRLDATVPGRLVELDRAEEVSVIGERDRGHVERLGALEQRVDLDGTVEQRVLAVEVQVDERSGRHPYSHSIVAGGFEEMS
jgi:hypothetical protein